MGSIRRPGIGRHRDDLVERFPWVNVSKVIACRCFESSCPSFEVTDFGVEEIVTESILCDARPKQTDLGLQCRIPCHAVTREPDLMLKHDEEEEKEEGHAPFEKHLPLFGMVAHGVDPLSTMG